ncbi:TetR/AcrR family transcriptional regulator [Pseudodonghicola flavimaris]|uniref:TetR/AcrR family transcriptional regulator n=1 Tax=Pseudodonghicola flavimaris TaxID=3050036 RepID=A0ABT7EV82_9RHOB|nr:TetR/AcrR family transcriptional regulator [Pseudodonghicola flavimaris]MDK3016249.1 TetR/AcrR family transcriptional regulator [Pseudodonghicola flavimaris]
MRLTRKQTQEQTRARLLDAAAEAVFDGGIAAISIRGICEAAGYSQGAFYSNFADRDDLLLALMRRHIEEEAANLDRLIADMGRPPEARPLEDDLQRIARWLSDHGESADWSRLTAEFKLEAQRNPAFAAGHATAAEAFHHSFARLMNDLVTRHGLRPVLPARDLSIGLYALWNGLALQAAVDPKLERMPLYLAFFRAVTGSPAPATPDHPAT